MPKVATATKALVTGIALLDTREINPNVFDVANEAGFDDLMQIAGRYKPTDQPNYHHFVNEDLFQQLVIDNAGVTGSGTPTLTITITATGFARRGLKLKFKDGKVGYISSAITTASSKDSFTVKSVDGTNLTAVAADKMNPMGIVTGEGSDEVDPMTYGLTKYYNLVEHMKDKTEITDIQKASKITVGDGYYAFLQAVNQAQAFKSQISATLIGGVKSVSEFGGTANLITDKDGNPMQTTGGLDGEIKAYGVNDSVATAGTVALSDYDDLCDQLTAVKAPHGFTVLSNDGAKRKTDTMWKNMNSAGISSVKLNFDGKEIDFNAESVGYGNFNFKYAYLKMLDHPQLFGGTGIAKSIYGIPDGSVKVQAGPGGAGGMEPRIGVRYMANNRVNANEGTNIIREWYTGALAPNPTSGKEVLTAHFSTTQGLEAIGTRQMFRQTVLA